MTTTLEEIKLILTRMETKIDAITGICSVIGLDGQNPNRRDIVEQNSNKSSMEQKLINTALAISAAVNITPVIEEKEVKTKAKRVTKPKTEPRTKTEHKTRAKRAGKAAVKNEPVKNEPVKNEQAKLESHPVITVPVDELDSDDASA